HTPDLLPVAIWRARALPTASAVAPVC
ncbi:MAG: hypothetical protein QG602_1312, partial [Verrucomicrobiota bacterium]|nr:hypothetical protein [Verrucomicrobiota bacterium]